MKVMAILTGLRLLGFKDSSELAFEDNIKHSMFLHPDENVRHHHLFPGRFLPTESFQAFSGSVRTFSALLKSMLAKNKIGLVMGIARRNSAPMFYALIPQVALPRVPNYLS